MMIQMKQKRAASSVQMYLGIKPVYRERICRVTGTIRRPIRIQPSVWSRR
jgi:hypothetical protein